MGHAQFTNSLDRLETRMLFQAGGDGSCSMVADSNSESAGNDIDNKVSTGAVATSPLPAI